MDDLQIKYENVRRWVEENHVEELLNRLLVGGDHVLRKFAPSLTLSQNQQGLCYNGELVCSREIEDGKIRNGRFMQRIVLCKPNNEWLTLLRSACKQFADELTEQAAETKRKRELFDMRRFVGEIKVLGWMDTYTTGLFHHKLNHRSCGGEMEIDNEYATFGYHYRCNKCGAYMAWWVH